MHSKKSRRWLKLVSATLAAAATVGLAITAPSQAVSPNPTPYCSEGTCWVTFDYTGDSYVWTPPPKVSSLYFDVYGAQGGRSGGKGGSVSGYFAVIPSSLTVFVGGMGASANSAPGGFNGGGMSGNGHGDQGSGGGASDLRTSTNLGDRVVVAGGGGGTGGWIGGAGGAGGLTIANSGSKGNPSGTAGGGGTQVAGGVGGLGVTTGNGTVGNLGTGGIGGSGNVAGGGGGGGGFFGGGGGGADGVIGGLDGSGGGGGSSFATMALTTSVTHQAGVRSGHGQVVLRYTFAPSVTAFTLVTPANSTSGNADYSITFDQLVYDLDPFDFKFGGTASGCTVPSATGNGYNFTVKITGCTNGTLNLSLRPNAVIGSGSGPAAETFASSTLSIDSQAPSFQIESPTTPTSSNPVVFRLTSTESFTKPTASAFQLSGSGCQLGTITMTNVSEAAIPVTGCQSAANVSLRLVKNQIVDPFGNSGPAADVLSEIAVTDYEAPSVVSYRSSLAGADLIEYRLEFSEAVSGLTSSSFTTSPGCAVSKLDGQGSSYQIWLTGCQSESQLTLKPLSATDAAGNLGPTAEATGGETAGDTVPPTATIMEIDRTNKALSPSFELRFDEQVLGLTINSLSRMGTAKDCAFTLSTVTSGSVYRVDSSGCSAGSLKVILLAASVFDTRQNPGPTSAVESPLVRIVEPEPTSLNSANLASLDAPPILVSSRVLPKVLEIVKQPSKEAVASGFLFPKVESLKPESWVSIAIALIALAVAKRSRGRRVSRR
jgi:hypothetical protein